MASLAPFMLLAPDEIAPGGSAASGAPPAAPPASDAGAAGGGVAAPGAAAQQARTTVDQIPEQALAAKLRAVREKARRDALAELGVEDPAKFKAEREEKEKRLAEYERAQEEQKRAQMSEVDRLKADLAAKDAQIADLQAQLQRAQGEAASTRFDVVVSRVIGNHVDPDMHEFATIALRNHMRTLPKDVLKKFGDADVDRFFAKLVKDKPRFAKAQPAAPGQKAPPPKRPLSNGAPPKAAAPPGTAHPANGSKPASQLTKEELRARWARFGARMPG